MMKCYEVTCNVFGTQKVETVGLMCDDANRACEIAEKSLLEGKHLHCTAYVVKEVERI